MFDTIAKNDVVAETVLSLVADGVWKIPTDTPRDVVSNQWHKAPSVVIRHPRLAYFKAELNRTWLGQQKRQDNEASGYAIEFAKTLQITDDPFLMHAAIRLIVAAIPLEFVNELSQELKRSSNEQPKAEDRDNPVRTVEAMRRYRLGLAGSSAHRSEEP